MQIQKPWFHHVLGNWAEKEKPYQDKNGNDLKADRLVAKQPLIYTRKQSGDDTEKDKVSKAYMNYKTLKNE